MDPTIPLSFAFETTVALDSASSTAAGCAGSGEASSSNLSIHSEKQLPHPSKKGPSSSASNSNSNNARSEAAAAAVAVQKNLDALKLKATEITKSILSSKERPSQSSNSNNSVCSVSSSDRSSSSSRSRSQLHCLHCGVASSSDSGIQVSCDECNAFLCNKCHWCHEFQANHEIRVCERCDGFFCRKCDEMDQCDACQEVVCSSCASLLSCKFCGAGMCEECATGCGRCGIVLCERDLKFAVECDTCKLPYCLVCLASAAKEPCVRCGIRQSKRVNQVVHLRLKSIYKAFQQSNNNNNTNNNSKKDTTTAANTSNNSNTYVTTAKSTKKRPAAASSTTAAVTEEDDTIFNAPGSSFYNNKTSAEKNNTNNATNHGDWGAFFGGDFCGLSSNQSSATFHNNPKNKDSNCDNKETSSDTATKGRYYGGERARMMMSVKAACVHAAGNSKHNNNCNSASSCRNDGKNCDYNHFSCSRPGNTNDTVSNDNYSRTEAEADAAAAALLKELEEEEEARIQHSNSKKAAANTKSKKKKQSKVSNNTNIKSTTATAASSNVTQGVAADALEEEQQEGDTVKFDYGEDNKSLPPIQGSNSTYMKKNEPIAPRDNTNDDDDNSTLEMEQTLMTFIDSSDIDGIEAFLASIKGVPGRAILRKNAKKALKRLKEEHPDQQESSTNGNANSNKNGEHLSNPSNHNVSTSTNSSTQPTYEVVFSSSKYHKGEQNNENSKNKKALLEDLPAKPSVSATTSTKSGPTVPPKVGITSLAATNKPLLKVVKQTTITNSNTSNSQSPFFNASSSSHSTSGSNNKQNNQQQQQQPNSHHHHNGARTECVMHMSPAIIGWVIGKGGQRIRDIMEEASARIWIDQNELNIQVDGYRVVYVSGGKKNVELAIKLLKDLISKAPISDNNKNNSSATNANAGIKSSTPVPSSNSATSAWGKAATASHVVASNNAQREEVSSSSATYTNTAVVSSTGIAENTNNTTEYTQVVQCEPRFVALLIGRRGWTVKHIQDESGARVDIDQTVTPRIIRISGSDKSQVSMATQMVRDVLSYPDAQLHYGDAAAAKEMTLMHHLLEQQQQQEHNSSVITSADHSNNAGAARSAPAAAKTSFDSLLPPLPTSAQQQQQNSANYRQFGAVGKQPQQQLEPDLFPLNRNSSSSNSGPSYLPHAPPPPPGYGITTSPKPASSGSVSSNITPLAPSSTDAIAAAARLERDMRSTTQSVLAGLYSPADKASGSHDVDASWPQSVISDAASTTSASTQNSFATPGILFPTAQEKQRNQVVDRVGKPAGSSGISMWSSQAGIGPSSSSVSYLGLSEGLHRSSSLTTGGSPSPFGEPPQMQHATSLSSSYHQQQSAESTMVLQQQPMSSASNSARSYSRMMELFSVSAAGSVETSTEDFYASDNTTKLYKSEHISNSASLSSFNTSAHHPSWNANTSGGPASAFTAVTANRGSDVFWPPHGNNAQQQFYPSLEQKKQQHRNNAYPSSASLPFSPGLNASHNQGMESSLPQPFYGRGAQESLSSATTLAGFPGPPMTSATAGFGTSVLQQQQHSSATGIASDHHPLWSRGFNNANSKDSNNRNVNW